MKDKKAAQQAIEQADLDVFAGLKAVDLVPKGADKDPAQLYVQ